MACCSPSDDSRPLLLSIALSMQRAKRGQVIYAHAGPVKKHTYPYAGTHVPPVDPPVAAVVLQALNLSEEQKLAMLSIKLKYDARLEKLREDRKQLHEAIQGVSNLT